MSAELTKVDSAVAGLSISPKDEKSPDKKSHKRTSSKSDGVWNIKDLGNPTTPCINSKFADSVFPLRGAKDRIGTSNRDPEARLVSIH